MKLRLSSDNWDYGTVGETVNLEGLNLKVGDIYSISDNCYNTTNCMIVNKQDEYSDKRYPFFMGLGIQGLMPNEKIEGLVQGYQILNIGDKYNSLIITED